MSDIGSPEHQTQEVAKRPSRSRKVARSIGLLLIVVSILLGWYLLIGYLGWQSGQTALIEAREVEIGAQLSRQMTLAQENIDQGSYNLALRRLAYILEHDPQNQEAQTLQKQAETELASLTAPLQAGGPTASAPTATPQPLPSPTPGLISDPQAELQRLRQLTTNGAWADALPALIAFQRQFPTVERQDTDRLLYDVYVNYGLTLLEGSQAELGLFYLEQAEKLGDLSQEVLDYRLWAELYLQGIAFYGVNWDVATYYFRELCVSAPFYQSACERLNQSLINFGDQYAGALDFCPAQELYQEALGYGRSQALVEKINQAGEACLLATPTPTAPITGTLPITGTVPLTDTNALPGSSFILPTPTTDSNQ